MFAIQGKSRSNTRNLPEEIYLMKKIAAAAAESANTPGDSIDPDCLAQWMARVKVHGRALENAPKLYRTAELCLTAVRQNAHALCAVPAELRTAEMCEIAVKRHGTLLNDVPASLKTPEICLTAVKQQGWALEFVPKEKRTLELCLQAVAQEGCALKFVPKSLRTPEICLAAVQQDRWALQLVPKFLERAIRAESQPVAIDPASIHALRLRCIAADGRAIQSIPKADQTPEFLREALAANFDVLKSVDRQALLQEGSEDLHEFMDENWDQVVYTLGKPEATKLAKAIMALQKEETRERQVA